MEEPTTADFQAAHIESLKEELTELRAKHLKYKDAVEVLTFELNKASAERDKLKEFKDYVHKRLDDAGIEIDPESPHKASGCRIGGRLDIALKFKAENERLKVELGIAKKL